MIKKDCRFWIMENYGNAQQCKSLLITGLKLVYDNGNLDLIAESGVSGFIDCDSKGLSLPNLYQKESVLPLRFEFRDIMQWKWTNLNGNSINIQIMMIPKWSSVNRVVKLEFSMHKDSFDELKSILESNETKYVKSSVANLQVKTVFPESASLVKVHSRFNNENWISQQGSLFDSDHINAEDLKDSIVPDFSIPNQTITKNIIQKLTSDDFDSIGSKISELFEKNTPNNRNSIVVPDPKKAPPQNLASTPLEKYGNEKVL
jgi:hypothetical protein